MNVPFQTIRCFMLAITVATLTPACTRAKTPAADSATVAEAKDLRQHVISVLLSERSEFISLVEIMSIRDDVNNHEDVQRYKASVIAVELRITELGGNFEPWVFGKITQSQ